VTYDPGAVSKYLAKDGIPDGLMALERELAELDSFTPEPLERCLRGVAEKSGLKAAALIHATRVAVTGRSVSPGLFEVLEILGREWVAARLHAALSLLTQ